MNKNRNKIKDNVPGIILEAGAGTCPGRVDEVLYTEECIVGVRQTSYKKKRLVNK